MLDKYKTHPELYGVRENGDLESNAKSEKQTTAIITKITVPIKTSIIFIVYILQHILCHLMTVQSKFDGNQKVYPKKSIFLYHLQPNIFLCHQQNQFYPFLEVQDVILSLYSVLHCYHESYF